MTQEIVRELIDGVWVTRPKDQTGGGGSQTVKRARFPFAFDTAGILTGVVAYTPDAGDILIGTYWSTPTAWDGTTPFAYLYAQGETYTSKYMMSVDLTGANDSGNAGIHAKLIPGSNVDVADAYVLDGTPLKVIVDDGNGGDPGSAAGSTELVLILATS